MRIVRKSETLYEALLKVVRVTNVLLQPDNRLANRECEIVAFVMSKNKLFQNIFYKDQRRELKDFFKMKDQTIINYKNSLMSKGWIDEEGLLTKMYFKLASYAIDEFEEEGKISLNVEIEHFTESEQ